MEATHESLNDSEGKKVVKLKVVRGLTDAIPPILEWGPNPEYVRQRLAEQRRAHDTPKDTQGTS